MNKPLHCAWLLCLLASTAMLGHAQDEPASGGGLVISSGLEGGGYWSAGERLRQVAAARNLEVENQASSGSLKNLERLFHAGSPVSLAFAQADALRYYLDAHPEAVSSVQELESIGEECIFIISEGDGDIETIGDMETADRVHLGIKSPKSGIWVTFNYMSKLVPTLEKVSLIYGDTVDMMNELLSPLTNIDRAVMVVQGTNARSPEIDMAAADPDKYRFVEIADERFTRALDGGAPIYHRREVQPGAVEGADAFETICVRGLLLANREKLAADQLGALRALVDDHWHEIHLEQ